MQSRSITQTRWFVVTLAASLAIAFLGWALPQGQRPLNFYNMLWRSLPLAGIWLIILAISAVRFRKKALWLLIGAPLTLYWPLWILINGIPACYWHGTCE